MSYGRLPDLIVIGAVKCGTTSLASYLDSHADIHMSRPKELRFFTDNWTKGENWYRSCFAGAPEGALLGEASPQYTLSPLYSGIPTRMASVVPRARLIYMVRDPIDQMKSHFRHLVSKGRESQRQLDEAVRANNRYLAAASFGFQLGLYLEEYASHQILVIDAAQLDADRASTIRRTLDFLGVEGDIPEADLQKRHNTAEDKLVIPGFLSTPRKLWRRASPVTGLLPRRWRHSLRGALGRSLPESALTLRSDTAKWIRSRIGPDLEMLLKLAGPSFQLPVSNWLEHLDRLVSEGDPNTSVH